MDLEKYDTKHVTGSKIISPCQKFQQAKHYGTVSYKQLQVTSPLHYRNDHTVNFKENNIELTYLSEDIHALLK